MRRFQDGKLDSRRTKTFSIREKLNHLMKKDSECIGVTQENKVENFSLETQFDEDNCKNHPLVVLFPDLQHNCDIENILKGFLEPEEITRKLIGKTAYVWKIKKLRPRRLIDIFPEGYMTVIFEEDELNLYDIDTSSSCVDTGLVENDH